MNQPAFLRRLAIIGMAALAPFSVYSTSNCAVSLPSRTSPSACSSPEFRQFDFWLGDWDAFDPATNAKDSHVRVSSILDGCVTLEDYQSVDGHKGQSFSIYDVTRNLWHQTWVTNRGRLLTIEGRFENGSMVLAGADRTAGGQERLIRGIWKPSSGSVRETAFTSLDGGKTWQPWFDLVFRPHK